LISRSTNVAKAAKKLGDAIIERGDPALDAHVAGTAVCGA